MLYRLLIVFLLSAGLLAQGCSSGDKEPNTGSNVGADTMGGASKNLDDEDHQTMAPGGATSLQDLGQSLFKALKANDFKTLDGMLPTRNLVSNVQVNANKDTSQPDVLKRSSAELQDQLQRDFQTVEQQAQKDGVDWANADMKNVSVLGTQNFSTGLSESTIDIPVTYNNKNYTISTQGTNVNGKWYLSGYIRWTPEDKSSSR